MKRVCLETYALEALRDVFVQSHIRLTMIKAKRIIITTPLYNNLHANNFDLSKKQMPSESLFIRRF